MKRVHLAAASGLSLLVLGVTGCEGPVGAGAGYGAAAGAIIGGAATGNVRGAAIGAASGAAAGALFGAAIREDQVRNYGPVPSGGFPYARYAGGPGIYRSPYTGRIYDLRGVPHGGLSRDVDTGQLFRRP